MTGQKRPNLRAINIHRSLPVPPADSIIVPHNDGNTDTERDRSGQDTSWREKVGA
jgi:hypothetical protein